MNSLLSKRNPSEIFGCIYALLLHGMWQHSAGHIPETFTLLSLRLFLGHALEKTWGKCQKYIALTMLLHSPGELHHYCAPSTLAQTPQSHFQLLF